MAKIMKCFECKDVLEYEREYKTYDQRFLIDEDARFVAQIIGDKVFCIDCLDK